LTFGERKYNLTNKAADKLIQFSFATESEVEKQDEAQIPTEYLRVFYLSLKWNLLSSNENLSWSFELIFEFEYLWHFLTLARNKTAFQYALKEDLNDDFIGKVMHCIESNYKDIEIERLEMEIKKNEAPF
jgi:hypothetical protein